MLSIARCQLCDRTAWIRQTRTEGARRQASTKHAIRLPPRTTTAEERVSPVAIQGQGIGSIWDVAAPAGRAFPATGRWKANERKSPFLARRVEAAVLGGVSDFDLPILWALHVCAP